jgi:hypothetical protein
MTATLTRCTGCREQPAASEGYCADCDQALAEGAGRLGLSDALRYLPLEAILRTIRDHCAAQVGPCWTARERELSCVADDLGTTLRETRWEVLSP